MQYELAAHVGFQSILYHCNATQNSNVKSSEED